MAFCQSANDLDYLSALASLATVTPKCIDALFIESGRPWENSYGSEYRGKLRFIISNSSVEECG
jgi:hypothetical protein